MRKAIFALIAGLLLCAQSPVMNGFPPGAFQSRAAIDVGTGGGGCSDTNATAWAAAVVVAGGTVSGTQLTNVCNLITAYKAHGVWTLLDREWLYASENVQQAKIDIVNLSSHTIVGSPVFTVNRGYAGTGSSTDYINTGYAPGTHYTQNSASLGAYVINNRTTGDNTAITGSTNTGGGTISFFRPLKAGGGIEYEVNGNAFPALTNPAATSQGNYIFSRTSSSNISPYRNASALTAGTSTSGAIPSFNFYVLIYNNNGAPNSPSADKVASVFFGGALDSAHAASKNSDLNTYMTAVGANVY